MSDGTLNLMVPRGEKSVWDKPGLAASLSAYDRERWAGAAVGSGLTLIGARRGGIIGSVMAGLGALIVIRAAAGRHDLGIARGLFNRAIRYCGWCSKDIVANASEESFPASDAPSWTSTSGAKTKR